MKKTKFLAIVLTLAVMITGVGYALWHETLTINGTVKTGELKMEFMESGFTENRSKIILSSEILDRNLKDGTMKIDLPSTSPKDINTGVGYATKSEKSLLINNKTATVAIDQFYPGAWAMLDLKVKNTGNIPAILEKIVAELKFYKNGQEVASETPNGGSHQLTEYFQIGFGVMGPDGEVKILNGNNFDFDCSDASFVWDRITRVNEEPACINPGIITSLYNAYLPENDNSFVGSYGIFIKMKDSVGEEEGEENLLENTKIVADFDLHYTQYVSDHVNELSEPAGENLNVRH